MVRVIAATTTVKKKVTTVNRRIANPRFVIDCRLLETNIILFKMIICLNYYVNYSVLLLHDT